MKTAAPVRAPRALQLIRACRAFRPVTTLERQCVAAPRRRTVKP